MEQSKDKPTYEQIRERCSIVVDAVLELSEINITKEQRAKLAMKGLDMIERILTLGVENS